MQTPYTQYTQFNFAVPNVAGQLNKTLELLTGGSINVIGLTTTIAGNLALVGFVTSNPDATRIPEILKPLGLTPIQTPVFGISLPNTTGALGRLVKFLGENNVNINGIYGSTPESASTSTVFVSIDTPVTGFSNPTEVFEKFAQTTPVAA